MVSKKETLSRPQLTIEIDTHSVFRAKGVIDKHYKILSAIIQPLQHVRTTYNK